MAAFNETSAHLLGVAPRHTMLFLGQPFTAAEAAAVGITAKQLRRMRRTGLVRTVLKGVFIDSASSDTIEMRAEALSKVAPAHCIITDRTAAWLLGADILGASGRDALPPVDVFRSQGHTRLRRTGCRSGTRTLDEDQDLQRVGGLLTTTPLRTALDLGRLLRRGEAIGALDALRRVGRLETVDLSAELRRFKGARGVVQLRQLVPLSDPRAESPAESRSRLLLVDADLPAPEVQWEVRNDFGVVVYRLDLAYPDIKLAIEYDGEEFHTSQEDRTHDEMRRAYLRRLGWTFVILTRKDVYVADPAAANIVRAERDRLLRRR